MGSVGRHSQENPIKADTIVLLCILCCYIVCTSFTFHPELFRKTFPKKKNPFAVWTSPCWKEKAGSGVRLWPPASRSLKRCWPRCEQVNGIIRLRFIHHKGCALEKCWGWWVMTDCEEMTWCTWFLWGTVSKKLFLGHSFVADDCEEARLVEYFHA